MLMLVWCSPGEGMTTYDAFSKVQLGMPRRDAPALLGVPAVVRYDADFRAHAYYYEISGKEAVDQGFLVYDARGKVGATGLVFFPPSRGTTTTHRDLARELVLEKQYAVCEEGENYTVLSLSMAPVFAVVQSNEDGSLAVYVMTKDLYTTYSGL